MIRMAAAILLAGGVASGQSPEGSSGGGEAAAGAESSRQPTRAQREKIQEVLRNFDRKDYDRALEDSLVLLGELPDDSFVMNLAGAAHTRKKNYAEARALFDRALVRTPNFFAARFNIGELMFLQKQYGEALEYFRGIALDDPRNELVLFKIFLCQAQKGDMEGAEKTMKLIKYPGDTPAWYYAQAAWEARKGNKKKANEYVTGARYIFGPRTAIFDETFEELGIKTGK